MELQASSGLTTLRWHQVNWAACHRRVRSLQRRIVQAVQAGAWRKVKRLSSLLVHSCAARALAVRRVTENTGKKTPGVDNELWETPEKKATAIDRIVNGVATAHDRCNASPFPRKMAPSALSRCRRWRIGRGKPSISKHSNRLPKPLRSPTPMGSVRNAAAQMR